MIGSRSRMLMLVTLILACAACRSNQKNFPTTEMQMRSMDEVRASYGRHFSDMVDNATLSDMTVSDLHFIPHTSELSGVGEVKLGRFSKLLNTYGGTVRYETMNENSELVKDRMQHVHEYLSLTGCNMERVEVAVMMPGGSGIPGDEAVERYRQPFDKPRMKTGTERPEWLKRQTPFQTR